MAELKLKKYIYFINNGHCDTVWAKTKRNAIKEALKKYPKYQIVRVEIATNDIW